MFVCMSLSKLSFDTISPAVNASLMAKFSVNGFASDSANDLNDLPILLNYEIIIRSFIN